MKMKYLPVLVFAVMLVSFASAQLGLDNPSVPVIRPPEIFTGIVINGTGGGGNVSSVNSSNNCILVSPTTGDVVMTLNATCAALTDRFIRKDVADTKTGNLNFQGGSSITLKPDFEDFFYAPGSWIQWLDTQGNPMAVLQSFVDVSTFPPPVSAKHISWTLSGVRALYITGVVEVFGNLTADELFATNICYSDGTNCTGGGGGDGTGGWTNSSTDTNTSLKVNIDNDLNVTGAIYYPAVVYQAVNNNASNNVFPDDFSVWQQMRFSSQTFTDDRFYNRTATANWEGVTILEPGMYRINAQYCFYGSGGSVDFFQGLQMRIRRGTSQLTGSVFYGGAHINGAPDCIRTEAFHRVTNVTVGQAFNVQVMNSNTDDITLNEVGGGSSKIMIERIGT